MTLTAVEQGKIITKKTNMNPIILQPENDEQWLQWKSEDISSTEVSALYNKSPYSTAFSLYHEKAGLLDREELKSKRAFWGKIYEAPTAEAIAKMYGVKVRPMKGLRIWLKILMVQAA